MSGKKLLMAFAALALGLGLAQQVTLVGAGSTFVYPIMAKWGDEYNKLTKGQVRVNYQSIGSGGGIRQFLEQTVHFGATDAPLADAQMKEVRDRFKTGALNIPVTLGAVVVTYNLPGVRESLNFTGELVADIFLGKVKTWNDPRIQELNPNVKLPPLPITVVHRSDGSGTTYIFVDYLSKVSSEWASKVGRGTSVQWPTGIGAKGNEGVAGAVKQSPGAIGYVELTYAVQNNLPYGAVQNRASGKFILPTLESIREASNVPLPGDARVSITDTKSPNGYPISGFVYVLLYEKLEVNKAVKSEAEARALVEFLKWALEDGQNFAEPLKYVRLGAIPVERAHALLSRTTYQGKPIGKEILGR